MRIPRKVRILGSIEPSLDEERLWALGVAFAVPKVRSLPARYDHRGSPDATGGLRPGEVSMLWGGGFAPGEVVAM